LDDKDIAPRQTVTPEPAPASPANEPTVIPASPDVQMPSQANATAIQGQTDNSVESPVQGNPTPATIAAALEVNGPDPFKGAQERPEVTKVILSGDRLRKYFPDVNMTPREIEESVYSALEERRQRQMKEQQKAAIFKRGGQAK